MDAETLFLEIVFPSPPSSSPADLCASSLRSQCTWLESTAARSWDVRLSSSSPVIDAGVYGTKQPLLSRSKRRRIQWQKIKLARFNLRAAMTTTLVVSCRMESDMAHREENGLPGGGDMDARVLVVGGTVIDLEEGKAGLLNLQVVGQEDEADELLLVEEFSAPLNTVDRTSLSGAAPVYCKKAL